MSSRRWAQKLFTMWLGSHLCNTISIWMLWRQADSWWDCASPSGHTGLTLDHVALVLNFLCFVRNMPAFPMPIVNPRDDVVQCLLLALGQARTVLPVSIDMPASAHLSCRAQIHSLSICWWCPFRWRQLDRSTTSSRHSLARACTTPMSAHRRITPSHTPATLCEGARLLPPSRVLLNCQHKAGHLIGRGDVQWLLAQIAQLGASACSGQHLQLPDQTPLERGHMAVLERQCLSNLHELGCQIWERRGALAWLGKNGRDSCQALCRERNCIIKNTFGNCLCMLLGGACMAVLEIGRRFGWEIISVHFITWLEQLHLAFTSSAESSGQWSPAKHIDETYEFCMHER